MPPIKNKNKIKGEVKQVLTNFCTKENWYKRGVGKDLMCKNCSTPYKETPGEYIGLMVIIGKPNAHVCKNCAEYFKTQGATDIDKISEDHAAKKKELLEKITTILGTTVKYNGLKQGLDTKDNAELEKILNTLTEEREAQLALQKAIENDFTPCETEQYLIDDWSIVEDRYLKHELEIESYFKDMGYEYFDCGQGYSQDIAEIIVKIGCKFYKVTMKAEIGSQKQDRGERLYWVEGIENVTYEEIEKPIPKKKTLQVTTGLLNEDQHKALIAWLDQAKITHYSK